MVAQCPIVRNREALSRAQKDTASQAMLLYIREILKNVSSSVSKERPGN